MKAIILAAGRGSRMLEATANLPKCMMKLWGKTLLDYSLESLQKAGFMHKDIGIVTGYKSEVIHEQCTIPGISFFNNADWESTNMFISLTKAHEWLKSEPCIVSYSDIVYSPIAIKKLIESKSEFAITFFTGFWDLWCKRFDNPLDDIETFKMKDGKLIEIGKKPSSKDDIHGQYMGLLKFEPSGWEKIEHAIKLPMPKTVEKLDMTTLLQHLLSLGNTIETIETHEMWFECDNQNDIEVYEKNYQGISNA